MVLFRFCTQIFRQNKELQMKINNDKAVSTKSHFFRAWRIYTREGLGVEYSDLKKRDEVFERWLDEEFKFVFKELTTMNPHVTPNEIYKLMADYYVWDIEILKKRITP